MIPSQSPYENTTSESLERRCFDPVRATSPTRMVPLGQVVDLLQVTHAPERVDEYRKAMERGQRFPPIAVVALGKQLIIADGHKRFAAYKTLPVQRILVEVWTMRRCLRDLVRQSLRQAKRGWRILLRTPRDSNARDETLQYVRSQFAHWRRIVSSLIGPN
ncbi:MAG TPA: hypothetical protein VGL91_17190 [Acidobacteriota bacterium]|jgi:hypothetical protein